MDIKNITMQVAREYIQNVEDSNDWYLLDTNKVTYHKDEYAEWARVDAFDNNGGKWWQWDLWYKEDGTLYGEW